MPAAESRHTRWDFGALPELMEIRKGGQVLLGFPALIDDGDAVRIEVFDEPDVAAVRHRAGLRRLFALQIRDALRYLEKNIPDLQTLSVAWMQVGRGGDGRGAGGTADELRTQIVQLALDRAFMSEPLPQDAAAFEVRLAEGRGRLNLIAGEVSRLAGSILAEHAAVLRKLRDTRGHTAAVDDMNRQLARLVHRRCLTDTPWTALQHLPRYLKAMQLRLDKLRADPARDAARMAELLPLEQRHARLAAERRGVADARLDEFRWLLEELRVSLFAQELRTPQPVSVRRLEKVWAQMQG